MHDCGITLDQRIYRGDPAAQQTFIQASRGRLSIIAGFRMPETLHRRVKVHQVLQTAQVLMVRRQAEFHRAAPRSGFLWLREILLQTINRLTDRFALQTSDAAEQMFSRFTTLSSLDKEILALRHYEELTNEEAALVTGISAQGLSSRYLQILYQVFRESVEWGTMIT
jgi:RNA polymerase sigma-70 factor (ECF subfamily)